MTNHKAIYTRIWRTAFERDSFALHYPTQAEAVRMRLQLYRAARPYRLNPELDPGFTAILDRMESVIDKVDNEWILTIRLKELNPLLIEASAQLDSLLP